MFRKALIRLIGLKSLFGDKANTLPLPQQKEPTVQTAPLPPQLYLKPQDMANINLIRQAIEQMSAMTDILILAQRTIHKPKINKKDELILKREELIVEAAELLEVTQKDALLRMPIIKRYDILHRNSYALGEIDMASLLPLIIDITELLKLMKSHCASHLKIISNLETIVLLPRSDEIQTKLHIAMERSDAISKNLSSLFLKSLNIDGSPKHRTPEPE